MATSCRLPFRAIVIALMGMASDSHADSPPPQVQLTITGRVLMPDGSPAAGAIVSSLEGNGVDPKTTKTGPDGRFQMSGRFWSDCRLHARSPDETHQATLLIPAALARTHFVKPAQLKLAPAREYAVSVLSAGKPVEAAQVLVESGTCKISKLTSAEGIARFWIPTDEKLRSLVAWHPKLGAAGKLNHAGIPGETAQLTLVPPQPHLIRVVDDHGQPVPDLKLGISVGLSGRNDTIDWIASDEIEKAQGRTDEHGELKLTWIPKENLKLVNPEIIEDDAWKVDEIDRDKVPEGITTLRVRRKVVVHGRLKMPAGANAEGVLITGFGFGPGSNGDAPRARAGADGSYSFAAASDHGYALRIADAEWASNDWSGMILATDKDNPATIALEAYAATPLEVHVTRGPQHDPVPKAWVLVGCERSFYWKDSQGEKHGAAPSMYYWLLTDANGMARMGVGKGKHKVSLSLGNWSEERAIEIRDDEKITVAFYRSWLKSRTITGRLVMNESPQNAFPTTVIRAEARENRSVAILPDLRPDGTFKLEADASDVVVFVLDSQERLSGLAKVGASADTIDLALSPTAAFGGVVVDENGKPLQGAQLQLLVEETRFSAATAQVTDERGNFRFGAVAANLPVRLQIRRQSDGTLIHSDRPRFFLPGEVREKTRVVTSSRDSTDWKDANTNPQSLTDRVSNVTRNARLNGMHALVVLQGDSSEDVKKLTEAIQDFEELPEVLGFLPAVIDAKSVISQAATVKEYGWQLPASGEIVLIALAGNTKQIGSQRVVAREYDAALKLAVAFIKQNTPPVRDAKALLAAARAEGKRSGRRIWVVEGGPRCRPCLSLAGWMDEQHALLDQDYVIVKVLEGYDKSVDEVMKVLDQPEGKGIPWMAITDSDGAVLATSDGPLGNIGFPSTIEDVRHLREMFRRTAQKLTAKELDQLVGSLLRADQ